jgi:MaoC like domain
LIHEATTPSSALKWAEFSGDFNPIHFDQVQATKLGSERLVVHGMLALLHVKHETLQALKKVAPVLGWSRYKALFRSPIPQSSPLQLLMRPKSNAVRFSLECDGLEYSRGLHEVADAPALHEQSSPMHWLEPGFVQTQHAQFCNSFKSVSEAWIFLDALIFSRFLEHKFAQIAEMSPDMLAVQVSHTVVCDANRLHALFSVDQHLPSVGYSVREVKQKGSQEESASGVAQLDVFADGVQVMQIEIGLLTKISAVA